MEDVTHYFWGCPKSEEVWNWIQVLVQKSSLDPTLICHTYGNTGATRETTSISLQDPFEVVEHCEGGHCMANLESSLQPLLRSQIVLCPYLAFQDLAQVETISTRGLAGN